MHISTKALTLEARAPRHSVAAGDDALAAYAGLVSRVERVMLSEKNRKQPIAKGDYMARFGLNGRQFNSIKTQLEGKVASQRSNLRNYIQDDRVRVSKLKKTVSALEKRLKKEPHTPALCRKADGKRQRLAKVTRRLSARQDQLDTGYTRLCFGSRRLFNAQHHLEENGYADHQEWKDDWQAARSARIFIKGSKDEPCGCRNAQLERSGTHPSGDGLYQLTLNLPPALHAQFGKTVTLDDLRFPRQGATAAIDAARRPGHRLRHPATAGKPQFEGLPHRA